MNVELIISKDRVPYLVEALGEDRVTIGTHSEDQDTVAFELKSHLDVLYAFHAGIRYGSDSMANALIRK
jgi:hypothetical protein